MDNEAYIRSELTSISTKLQEVITATALNTKRLEQLTKTLEDNGRPGLVSRFQEVEANQRHCIAMQRGLMGNWKSVVVVVIAVAAFFKDQISRVIILLLLLGVILVGCKSIVNTEYDQDGNIVKEYRDNSFTLGGSEGAGKTLLGINIGNDSANDGWSK